MHAPPCFSKGVKMHLVLYSGNSGRRHNARVSAISCNGNRHIMRDHAIHKLADMIVLPTANNIE